VYGKGFQFAESSDRDFDEIVIEIVYNGHDVFTLARDGKGGIDVYSYELPTNIGPMPYEDLMLALTRGRQLLIDFFGSLKTA
jgi:hypothetical protein